MKKTIRLALTAAVLSSVLLTGCARSYIVLLPNPDGSVGKVVVQGEKGQQWIDKAETAVPLDGSKAAETVSKEKISKDFGEAMSARPQIPEHFVLYFQSGGAELTTESLAALPKVLKAIAARPAVDVSVIGHTDTVGDKEFNRSLSLSRAQMVADLLKQKGLKVHDLIVDSHGESNPLVRTSDNTSEPRNRRVEIAIR